MVMSCASALKKSRPKGNPMIEEALILFLKTNITGCSFEWLDTDQEVTPPFAILRGEGEDLIRSHQGTSDLVSVDIAIDIYAVTPAEAISLERSIKAALLDYRGPMDTPAGTVRIDSVDHKGRFSGRESSTKLVYQTVNYEIWYR